jgi:hypothetical protein
MGRLCRPDQVSQARRNAAERTNSFSRTDWVVLRPEEVVVPVPSIDNRVESGNTGPVMGNSSLRECLRPQCEGVSGVQDGQTKTVPDTGGRLGAQKAGVRKRGDGVEGVGIDEIARSGIHKGWY